MGVCMYLHSFLLSLEQANSKPWHDRPSTKGTVGTGSCLHSIGPALDVAASLVQQTPSGIFLRFQGSTIKLPLAISACLTGTSFIPKTNQHAEQPENCHVILHSIITKLYVKAI